jgi:DNA repair protein RadD
MKKNYVAFKAEDMIRYGFERRIRKSRAFKRCWIWIGKVGSNGYGKFSFLDGTYLAHRVSWMIYKGPIPKGKFLLHGCDNPACVRPDHLSLGDPRDNTKDMIRKGRAKFYEPRFAEEQIKFIRNSDLFECETRRNVSNIIDSHWSNQKWKNLRKISMSFLLRDYQIEGKLGVYEAWKAGFQNVLLVLPTGTGKTVTFSSIVLDMVYGGDFGKRPTAIMVHRQELVEQISLTLAGVGVRHNIIAQKGTINTIIASQRRELGKQFYDYHSPVTVLSVDTLNARIEKHQKWAAGIQFWVVDEAAHLLKLNKWGKAVSHFPNALGLGVTATPQRLDKKGLGRHADGVFDTIVEGPSTRWGIENGYLSKYKVVVPPSDYREHLKDAKEGSDFTKEAMLLASRKSHIIGDVVKEYIKWGLGKQAIVFADSTESGERMEKEFRAKNVNAKLLTGETPDSERSKAVQDFRKKTINVLINIDLFDEGFDAPGIQMVSSARPTMSLSKILQVWGRGLRPIFAPGFDLTTREGRLAAQAAGPKPYAILCDHVGNLVQHGLPDDRRKWTLDRIIKRRDKTNWMRVCQNGFCNAPFDRALTECPFCGTTFFTSGGGGGGGGRPALEQVDGDLILLDPETIREMEQRAQLEAPALVQQRVAAVAGPAAASRL